MFNPEDLKDLPENTRVISLAGLKLALIEMLLENRKEEKFEEVLAVYFTLLQNILRNEDPLKEVPSKKLN